MGKSTFSESVGKMLSLMERMSGNMTAYEATLNEVQHISEAAVKNRVPVTRDEILDILDQADDQQNATNSNLFATVTYVNAANLLKTKRSIDVEKLGGALNKHSDKSEEPWHRDLSAFRDAEKSSTKNPIGAIVTVTRYLMQWQSLANYGRDYGEYRDGLSSLRMSHGIGIQTDGTLGDNHNQRQASDATDAGKFNQTGNLARDFNMKRCVNKKTTAYIVDENGSIVSEIPDDVMWSIHAKRSPRGVEAEVRNTLSGEALEAYANAKAELDAKFDGRNLLFDKMLCICCSVNGVSYYYINDALISKITKGSEVNVNPQEMVKIAEEQLDETFTGIQGFADGTPIQ
jgi:hypothetical protein